MENDALNLRQQWGQRGRLAHASCPCIQAGAPGASGDAQPRIVGKAINPSSASPNERRLRAAPIEARDQKRSPGREPEPVRAKRARAFDQRGIRPASISPKGAAAPTTDSAPKRARRACRANESAPCDRAAGFVLQAGRGKYGRRACRADQRAHPPRRAVSVAGKGEEGAAEPRRDIAGLRPAHIAIGATRRRRRDKTAQPSRRSRRLKAHVRLDVAERQAAARIEDEAELRWQSAQVLVLAEPRFQRGDARREVEAPPPDRCRPAGSRRCCAAARPRDPRR